MFSSSSIFFPRRMVNLQWLVSGWDLNRTMKQLMTYLEPPPLSPATAACSLFEPIAAGRSRADAGITAHMCVSSKWQPLVTDNEWHPLCHSLSIGQVDQYFYLPGFDKLHIPAIECANCVFDKLNGVAFEMLLHGTLQGRKQQVEVVIFSDDHNRIFVAVSGA